MNRRTRAATATTLLALGASLIACAGGMNLSGKTPIVGTIRLAPTASCPVPSAAATSTATAAPTNTGGKQ